MTLPLSSLNATFTIKNSKGLHARPTAKLVKLAETFSSEIDFSYNGRTVSAKSIMGILMLGVGYGAKLEVSARGADAQEALNEIENLIGTKFGED